LPIAAGLPNFLKRSLPKLPAAFALLYEAGFRSTGQRLAVLADR
jgi:hypothetical protein